MSGEKDLIKLLKYMKPSMSAREYVFIHMGRAAYGDAAELKPIAMFIEDEGMTLVIPRSVADSHGIAYEAVFRCITLKVHSGLDAVGFTAAITGALAEKGIAANVIAAYFHDHIFVPADRAERALSILQGLSETAETRKATKPKKP